LTYLQKLKDAKTRRQLAEILGFKLSALTSIIYKTPLQNRYTAFDIAKKGGGTRTIKAPNPQLKKLQTHLSHVLYECLAEIEKGRNTSSVSFGFRPEHSIIANAHAHKRKRYVFNIDLEEFFPSIHFGRVRGFFLKDKNFSLTNEVATTIAQIACDGAALPQGSPCSPVISELIGQILDIRMLRLAKRYGVRYSRYADDLTFSTNQKSFPEALAAQDPAHPEIWTPGNSLLNEIARSDFRINPAKTRMQFRTSQQTVTGLVVNEKVNIRSNYYRNARAMCDALFQTGQYHKPLTSGQADDEAPDMISSLNPLEGILGHIYTVTQSEDKRDESIQRSQPRAIRSLYRRFLF
jgi:retron-type reverse transcriptase